MNEVQNNQEEDIEVPKWLEKLQKESWQAEILISGGAFIGIIGLLSNVDQLSNIILYSTKLDHRFSAFVGGMAGFPLLFLTGGFLLHLVLRGYWIGLIGMNYVFPQGINQQKLAFRGKFSSFIRVSSNTPYLIKLDKLCSLVFAFTFFIIFSIAGLLMFAGILSFIVFNLPTIKLPKYISIPIAGLIITFIISGLATLIDFFTFGHLRRLKWFSIVYYPLHYFMSYITLSFLYRRLYYTLVSNLKSRYLILIILVPISLVLLLAFSTPDSYKDILPIHSQDEGAFLSIKENVITGKSLQFSVMHMPQLEGELKIEWEKTNTDTSVKSFERIKPKERLKLIGSIYDIYVDSIQIKNISWMVLHTDGIFFETSKLVSLIDISDFPRGSHQLIVRIRFKPEEYVIERSNPNLNYYAKAYFFIDR
jgi:hypothetical protein